MLKAFFKDSAIYTIPAIISRGLALFLIPLYTRVLSPADYGSLDILTVFAGIINLTIALEVSQGVARFYAAEQNSERKILYSSSAFWFTLICYTIFALLMLVNTSSLATLIMGQAGLENAFQIGIVYIWINGLFYLTQNQFRWELRSKNYVIVSLSMSFVTASVSVLLVYGLRWGLEGLLIGMVAGSLVGTSLGLWWLRNSFRFRFDGVCLREMLSFSTPLVFSGVAVWISLYIDRIMINHYLTVDEVGVYGIGYRIASIAGLAMVGFQGALTPLVYTYYREADTPLKLSQIFRIFIAFALFMFLIISLFSNDIIRLLTTEPFYGGAVVVVYLVPAMLLSNMYIFAPGLGIAKKTHYFIWINVCGAIINVVLNILLIPKMGIIGAGLATMLGYLVVFCLYMFFSQRLYHVSHHWKPIALSVIISGLIAWYFPLLQLDVFVRWLTNLLVLTAFSVTLVAIGLIHPNEIKQGVSLIKNQLRLNK